MQAAAIASGAITALTVMLSPCAKRPITGSCTAVDAATATIEARRVRVATTKPRTRSAARKDRNWP
ncbi:hypothetical protein GCM10020254_02790 [Streptomyces goshikiensis]